MTSSRKLLGAAAFSLALAGGGAAGALLGTPSTSGAQDTDTTAEAGPTDARAVGHPGFGGPGGPRHAFGHPGLDAAAEVIGITADELEAELEAGQSIAEVAEANDVEPQAVIDALVASGLERLQELEEQLPERVAETVNRQGLPERRGPHGPWRGDAPADETESDA